MLPRNLLCLMVPEAWVKSLLWINFCHGMYCMGPCKSSANNWASGIELRGKRALRSDCTGWGAFLSKPNPSVPPVENLLPRTLKPGAQVTDLQSVHCTNAVLFHLQQSSTNQQILCYLSFCMFTSPSSLKVHREKPVTEGPQGKWQFLLQTRIQSLHNK